MLKLVKRKGSESWYIRGTVHGQGIFESTGTSDREIAELHLKKRTWELERREIFGEEATITFAEAALAYMNAGGEKRFMAPILVRIGKTALKDLSQSVIDNEGADAYPTASKATRRRQWYGPIGAVMNHVDFAFNLKKPKDSPPRIEWLEPEEADKMISQLAPHLRAVWPFILGTGARASEAARLGWENVNLDSCEVRFVDTKNGSSRLVPFPKTTRAALSTLGHRKGRVFLTDRGKPYATEKKAEKGYGGYFKNGILRASERAGIKRVTPHVGRHTWATWFYAATGDILRLQRYGGWSDANMAERYSHESPRGMDKRLLAHGWDFNWHPENEAKTEAK